LKDANEKKTNIIPFKKTNPITVNDIKQTICKRRTLTDEQCILVKDWLNNFLELSYKTWKQKQTQLSFTINQTEQDEESNIIYLGDYRRAS
jgi:hypothetical protein